MLDKNMIKEKKGLIAAEAIVAIITILLFSGIITTLIVNIVLESTKLKIYSEHLSLQTEILEYVEKMEYEEEKENIKTKLIQYIQAKHNGTVSVGDDLSLLTTPYKVKIEISDYVPPESSNLPQFKILRIIKITIASNIKGKECITETSTIKKATDNQIKDMLRNDI